MENANALSEGVLDIWRDGARREAYAAAAAKLSNGFAIVVQDMRTTKSTMNAEMIASLLARPPR